MDLVFYYLICLFVAYRILRELKVELDKLGERRLFKKALSAVVPFAVIVPFLWLDLLQTDWLNRIKLWVLTLFEQNKSLQL